MQYKTILFDLDGTLTDSAPGILNSVRYGCRRIGIPVPTKPPCAASSARR